jgi:short-subunit dehydrogenase
MEVRDRRALVTGASYGIGAAIARSLAERGARVVVAARTHKSLDALAAEIGGHALVVDLASPSDVDALLDRATKAVGGPIDVLVNNAGTAAIAPFAQQPVAAIDRQLQVNLNAVLALTRQALPGMLERQRGHLVFMSSLQAAAPTPAFATYGATKAAISHFASILRLELARTPIGITVVAPGPVDTPMWDRVEASPYTTALLRRYARAGLLTKDDPAELADKVVTAVERNARHVRTPRRALMLNALSEAPRRMTELLLTRVPLDAQ